MTCFFCPSTNTERHHCLHGTANRRKCDEDGLFVPLCHLHHRGTFGVHGRDGHEKDEELKRWAQRKYEKEIGTRDDFLSRYGRNYLWED